jgi:hypothetical protein
MPTGYYDGPLPITNRLNAPTYADMRGYGRGSGYAHLGASLGSLFGATPGARAGRDQQIFEQAALNSGRLEDVLAQARQRRDANIARSSAAQRYRDAAAADPAHARAYNDMADLFEMDKVNAGELGQFFVNQGKTDAQGRLATIAQDTSRPVAARLEAMQPDLALFHGQPVTLTKVEGQNVINPDVLPSSQTITTTDQGQAAIGEKKAQAAHAMAGAGAENALRDFRAGPQTDAERSLKAQRDAEAAKAGRTETKPAPANHFNEPTMVALFGAPGPDGKQVLDPAKVTRFQGTKEQLRASGDPQWNNDAHVFDVQNKTDAESAQGAPMNPPADLAAPESSGLASFFPPAAAAEALLPTPAQPVDAQGRGLSATGAAQAKRKVVRTGVDKKTGTPVVQYDDGTIEAAPSAP